MRITKKQLKRIIREEFGRIKESTPKEKVDYSGDIGSQSAAEYGQGVIDRVTARHGDQLGNREFDVEKEEAEETNADGDAYFVMVDDLVTSLGRQVASKIDGTEDEVYIMTGQAEGITVKVLRRGR